MYIEHTPSDQLSGIIISICSTIGASGPDAYTCLYFQLQYCSLIAPIKATTR